MARQLEVGNHKRRTLNTRLSSGTSAGTFAVSAGPYRTYREEEGTKNEPDTFFVLLFQGVPCHKGEPLSTLKDKGFVQTCFSSSWLLANKSVKTKLEDIKAKQMCLRT